MMINIPENASTEEKLLLLSDALESIKTALDEIIDEMDCNDQDTGAVEEAIDFIDNASDAIGETIDGLEEEELELDEEAEEDDDYDVPNGVHVGIVIEKG